ncbi:MAG: phage terminase large subunit [Candidatus Thiodiazotropha endolucinida]
MKPIEYAPKLAILGRKQKRLKILVGGRGSTKSTFVADYVLACMAAGQLWCCGREFQNTIDESVHRLMLEEVDRLEFEGFTSDSTHIYHQSGGRNFYRGLSRNPSGLKSSLTGVDGLWIEEGEKLSDETLRQMSASLRLSAKDIERSLQGEEVKLPEIWITMNRGSSKDPISRKWLKRAEPQLAKTGIYEDDYMLIVQINWDEIPRRWFVASGLENERLDDQINMTAAAYDHKWNGAYNDTVENAIILPDWFDACVDAHKRLGFEPRGIEVVSHDPSDGGPDPKGLAYRHGVVFLDVMENEIGDVNEGCDWATTYAVDNHVDYFVWDGDGMGAGLRRQVNQAFEGKHITAQAFLGASTPDYPDMVYEDGESENKKTNKQTFKNKRAQYYWYLRDRCHKTYQAVVGGKYIDPDELVSFSSNIEQLDILRSEVCRIPKKLNATGLIQIMTKKEMLALEIESPNMADSVMMNLSAMVVSKKTGPVTIPNAYTPF